MRVLTLDNTEFTKICKALENECSSSRPDLIIGIATGGVYVSKLMFNSIPHFNIKLQRSSSKLKEGHRRFFDNLSKLPRPVLDLMRIGEAYFLRFKRHKNDKTNIPIPENLIKAIQNARSILIVDDAVDSGVTMKSIVESCMPYVQQGGQLHTAAITITTPAPVIRPDYYIFDNCTLIRFPWSKDAR